MAQDRSKYRYLTIDRTAPYDRVLSSSNDAVLDFRSAHHALQAAASQQQTRSDIALQECRFPVVARGVFGLIGCRRFLEAYSLVYITKARCIATVAGHAIYTIEGTAALPLWTSSTKFDRAPSEEKRYIKLWQQVDLRKDFYFSYTYDLTRSLQANATITVENDARDEDRINEKGQHLSTGIEQFAHRFAWNYHLLRESEFDLSMPWTLPIVHGYIEQTSISCFC